MEDITTPHTPAAVRTRDGLAVIGRTLHDLRGIRFDGDEGGNAPAGQSAGTPAPGQPASGQPSHQRSTSNLPGPAQRAGEPTPPAPSGDPTPGGQPTGTPPAPTGTPTPPAPAPGQGQRQYTPEETEAYVRSVREEAKTYRERAEAAEAARAETLKALGLQVNADGNIVPFSPTIPTEQAQAQTAELQEARDTTARENLVLRVSTSLQADADKMLDSRSFAQRLAELAPDDRTGAEALVRDWVKDHPEHGLTPPPAAASGQSRHAGGAPVNGRKSREEALQARVGRKSA